MFFRWLGRFLLGLVVLAVVGILLFHSTWFQKKYVYPFPYQQLVFDYAEKNYLDPYLVAGLIYAESKFAPEAKSPKSARGLMQIVPETAAWLAKQNNLPQFTNDMLDDPDINIRLGTWYLASLHREFNNNTILSLAAYNAGRGNVQKWVKQNQWSMAFDNYDSIPFRETKEYVGRVMVYRQKYQELYGQTH